MEPVAQGDFPGTPFEVITFDHHTDVLPGGVTAIPGDWQDPEKTASAVQKLRHDEHLDWAVKSGLARKVKVFSHVNATTPADVRIKVLCDPTWPDEFTQLNQPECFKVLAEIFLDDRHLDKFPAALPERPFILDLDCDGFLCRKALHPEQNRHWKSLLKNASGLTISRESDYVRLLAIKEDPPITDQWIIDTVFRQITELAL